MAKVKRRANGEGTIVKCIKNGMFKGWRAVITVKCGEGYKRKEFNAQTQAEVKEKLERYKREMALGILPVDDKITLEEWYHTWLWEYRMQDMKPKTFETYDGIYRNYIKNSEIGRVKLKDLRTIHLQKYYNNLRIKLGKSASSIIRINTRIKPCLAEAEKQGYIHKNYCSLVTLPKKQHNRKIKILSAKDQIKFINTIKGHDLEMLFLTALSTGARLGELLALKWSDIDFNNGKMEIVRTLSRARNQYTRVYEIIEQSTKTINGARVIPIPSAVFAKLKIYRKKQIQQKLKMGAKYIEKNYVFANELGYPIDDKRPCRNLKSILKNIGVPPINFHGLRHTYATRLFEAKIQPKTVQMLMGHSDIKVTMNIYTHVMEDVKTEAVEQLNKIFAV